MHPNIPWVELVGGRLLIVRRMYGSEPFEVVLQEVSPSKDYIRIFNVSREAAGWLKADEYKLTEQLPQCGELAEMVNTFKLLDRLRNYDHASMVELICDNEGASHAHENVAIECCNQDTKYQPMRFEGQSIHHVTKQAAEHFDKLNAKNPHHKKLLP